MITDTFFETEFWHWGLSCIQQYNCTIGKRR